MGKIKCFIKTTIPMLVKHRMYMPHEYYEIDRTKNVTAYVSKKDGAVRISPKYNFKHDKDKEIEYLNADVVIYECAYCGHRKTVCKDVVGRSVRKTKNTATKGNKILEAIEKIENLEKELGESDNV